MSEMTDEDIDQKLNQWVNANHAKWKQWLDTVSENQKSNRTIIDALRLAFRAGYETAKQEKA